MRMGRNEVKNAIFRSIDMIPNDITTIDWFIRVGIIRRTFIIRGVRRHIWQCVRSLYPSDYAFGCDIVSDNHNRIYAVWASRNYALRFNIYLRIRENDRWGECIRLNEFDRFDSIYPSISVGLDSKVHMAWLDSRNGVGL